MSEVNFPLQTNRTVFLSQIQYPTKHLTGSQTRQLISKLWDNCEDDKEQFIRAQYNGGYITYQEMVDEIYRGGNMNTEHTQHFNNIYYIRDRINVMERATAIKTKWVTGRLNTYHHNYFNIDNPDKEYVYDTRETNKYIDNPNYLYANTTHVYGNEPIIWGKQSPGDKAPEPWWPNDNDKWWHFRIGIDGHFDPNGRRYITNNKGWKKYD